MNEHGGSWPAYTVGYGESFADDELDDAAETRRASRRAARPSKARSRPNSRDRCRRLSSRLEEPIASSSIVPMYFVCQRAKQDVKVVLIGQGPDELFGGYKRHLGVHYGELWRGLPGGPSFDDRSGGQRTAANETLKRGVYSLNNEDRLKRYQDVFSLAPAETIGALFRDGVLPGNGEQDLVDYWRELAPQMEGTDELGGFQLLEVRSSLPDELLMYADKLSMAHSLEVRVPYLDRTVVEYVQRLGANFKVRNGTRKWLHRQVCQSYLPRQILKRKKRGFAVNVVDDWFRSSMGSQIPEMLLDEQALVFDLLNPEPVSELLKSHRSGRQDNHKLLFSLVMLEHWLRRLQTKTDAALLV